jgi:hypothetical protein
MNAKSGKPAQLGDIDVIVERAERGEDISAHFTQNYRAKQRVNIDFPLALLRDIDTVYEETIEAVVRATPQSRKFVCALARCRRHQ